MPWIKEFRDRLDQFEDSLPPVEGEIPLSIKVRVDSGCYSRGCCPFAFRLIDNKLSELQQHPQRFKFEEHETGPELLVYLALTTAGLGLAKSMIEFVTAIIKARSEGRKHGDRHDEPVTLVIRRLQDQSTLAEERLFTFHQNDKVTDSIIEQLILDGSRKLIQEVKPPRKKTKATKYSRRKKK
ncbi:MAG: hypothetical protein ABSF91_07935 [Bacteroidota bacterium]|jgi:hypothetical protein